MFYLFLGELTIHDLRLIMNLNETGKSITLCEGAYKVIVCQISLGKKK